MATLLRETTLVTIGDLEAAARTLAPVAVRTPLLPADAVSEVVGAPIWIKPEMLQRGGAFKFRGAYNFLSHMDPDVRKRGVIAPSSGNHAQAVALGKQLVEKEQALDRQFANGSMDAVSLQALLSEIGVLQANIRYAHLVAHLEQKALLTTQQVQLYDQLRGYRAAHGQGHRHAQ